jgi:predicted nucleic-acid-binding protein
MNAIDTNILIRFITKDDDKQSTLVYQLFKNAEEKEEKLFVPLLVVLEIIWVLQSAYKSTQVFVKERGK